jgi:hypothetical protein
MSLCARIGHFARAYRVMKMYSISAPSLASCLFALRIRSVELLYVGHVDT